MVLPWPMMLVEVSIVIVILGFSLVDEGDEEKWFGLVVWIEGALMEGRLLLGTSEATRV